jgi:hypothetical protein
VLGFEQARGVFALRSRNYDGMGKQRSREMGVVLTASCKRESGCSGAEELSRVVDDARDVAG